MLIEGLFWEANNGAYLDENISDDCYKIQEGNYCMSGEERSHKIDIAFVLILTSFAVLCVCFGLHEAIKTYDTKKITLALLIFIGVESVRTVI